MALVAVKIVILLSSNQHWQNRYVSCIQPSTVKTRVRQLAHVNQKANLRTRLLKTVAPYSQNYCCISVRLRGSDMNARTGHGPSGFITKFIPICITDYFRDKISIGLKQERIMKATLKEKKALWCQNDQNRNTSANLPELRRLHCKFRKINLILMYVIWNVWSCYALWFLLAQLLWLYTSSGKKSVYEW